MRNDSPRKGSVEFEASGGVTLETARPIALTGVISGLTMGKGEYVAMLVAPVGASAVLLFAVPSSPLAQ